ncbi:MAG: FISUMP domain-containing protein [archaeon]
MRKVLLGTLILSLSMSFLLFVNCEKDATKPPDEPEVKLVSPVKNEVLIDSVSVEITATDDKGITQVEFIVDNEVAKTWIMSPYVYTWNVTAFTDSTDHLVYARAYDADDNVSTTSVVKVSVRLLFAPTKLSAQTVSDTQILLTWQDNSKIEDGFRIERKEEGGSYVQIAEVVANVTSFEDSGLTYGSKYYYRVRAYASMNNSAYSNQKLITVEISAPSDLDAIALDDQSIHLTWSDNCTFETGFSIECSTEGGEFPSFINVGANVTSFNDSGLTYGRDYYYQVRAYTSLNNSACSNMKSATTIFPAPSNLNATAIDDQSVRLTWTDNCSFETGFRIERKEASGSYTQITEVGANVTSFDDAGLTYGTNYFYRVRAFTSQNNSIYSNEKSVTLVIPAPSDLDATALDDQSVHLTWSDNCTFETGFRIERKEEGRNYSQITEVGANVTSFNDSGLTYGNDYYYQVRAYTSLNNSAYSNEKSTTTIFPAPSNLHATAIDDQSLRLIWTDNCTFETGFSIERKVEDGSYIQIAEVSDNVTSYDDAGVTYNKLYYYRVRAYTSLNNSTYSNEVLSSLLVIDIDDNVYATVKIGNQWWMAENLKVTHYRNGDAIPNMTVWNDLYTGAYCNYDNNATNADTYGRLYNWYAINDSRNIAPTGWHVPTDAEWQTLVDYLGGESVAGGNLKEIGITHWFSPNTGATNASGFSALPGGDRYIDGTYGAIGGYGSWWSATGSSSYGAWAWSLGYNSSSVTRYGNYKQYGFSVRCIRD